MPVAIAGFFGGLGLTAAGAVGVSLGWGAAMAVGAILVAATIVGVKRAIELDDPGVGSTPSGREIVIRSTEVPRIIVYGQAAVGGVITHQNTFGAESRSMTIEIIHTGHEIDSFVSWLFDDKEIPIADVDDIQAAGDGSVDADTNSHGFGPVGSTPIVFLRGWLGTSTQITDPMLDVQAYPGFITSDHRHRGCARSNIRLDLLFGSENIWDGGPPQNIRAVLKGKLVYDPRLDSTFSGSWGSGSGGHRVNDPTTWEWSSNPALCWADYRIDDELGPGWDSDDIDYNSVAIAADACEVAVDIPIASSENRFSCNGVFDTSERPNEIIGQILASMAGSERRFGGQWHVYAGVWEAPSFTLDEDDFIGTVEYRKQPETQSGDRYNIVRGSYVDPLRSYQSVEFLEVADTALQTDRDAGRELPKELNLRAVNGEYQAQRLAYRLVAQAADSGIFVCQVGYGAANMRVGVRVEISLDELGFADKVFRLVNMRHVPFTGFELTLKEDSEESWDDPDESDYGTRTSAGVIDFPDALIRPVDLVLDGNFSHATFGRYWEDDGNGGVSIDVGDADTGGNALVLEDVSVGTDRVAMNVCRLPVTPGALITGIARIMRSANIDAVSIGADFYRSIDGASIGSASDIVTADLVSASTWYSVPFTIAVPTFVSDLDDGLKPLVAIHVLMNPSGAGTATLTVGSIAAAIARQDPRTTEEIAYEAVDEIVQVENASGDIHTAFNNTVEEFTEFATMVVEETTDVIEVTATFNGRQAALSGSPTIGETYTAIAYRENPSGTIIQISQPHQYTSSGASLGDNGHTSISASVTGLTPDTYDFGLLAHVEETTGSGTWDYVINLVTIVATRIKR